MGIKICRSIRKSYVLYVVVLLKRCLVWGETDGIDDCPRRRMILAVIRQRGGHRGWGESAHLVRLAQDLEHRSIRGSEVIPTCLARPLNGANELDPCRFHGSSCCIDIVHAEGDHRTSGEETVKFLIGAIEFHLRAIGQLKPRNL